MTDEDMMQPLREARLQFEREYMRFHIERCDFNMTLVAEHIGMDRTAMLKKLRHIGVVQSAEPVNGRWSMATFKWHGEEPFEHVRRYGRPGWRRPDE